MKRIQDFGSDDSIAVQQYFNYLAASGLAGLDDSGKTFKLNKTIFLPRGIEFSGGKFAATEDFIGDNLFVNTEGGLKLSYITCDGSHLPTIGAKYNGTQAVKGCILVIDPDPLIPGTGKSTKSKLSDVTVSNCNFSNQASSWIYAINVSNGKIHNNVFKTLADEMNSNLAGIYIAGNKRNNDEVTNWKVYNNTFENIISDTGEGNVKCISVNGGDNFEFYNNKFVRTLLGSTEGNDGLHSGIFIKASKNVLINDNTFIHCGLGIKSEAFVHSTLISNNKMIDCTFAGVLVQGSYNVKVISNEIRGGGRYGLWIDPHSPTPVAVKDILIEGNTITGIGDMNLTDNPRKKASILVRAVSGLENQRSVIRNNFITAGTSTYAGVYLLTDNNSVIVSPEIINNEFDGNFVTNKIHTEGNVTNIKELGNKIKELEKIDKPKNNYNKYIIGILIIIGITLFLL